MSTATDTHRNALSAPLWRRFAALLYDLFLLLAISFAYGALLTALAAIAGAGTERDYQPMLQGPLPILGWLACLLGYYLYCWRKSGQTLGMKTWRLQLVTMKGATHPSWRHCWIRAAIGVPALLVLGMGYWYRWFNTRGLCWHDRISQTQVIVLAKST